MYCVYCGVKLQEGAGECPLCHTPVICPTARETAGRSLYPDRLPPEEKHGRTLLVWLLSTVMAAACLGCLIFCLHTFREVSSRDHFATASALLSAVLIAGCLGCLIFCLRTYGGVAWSGYVMMGSALIWVLLLFPLLFRRFRPMIFLPIDFVCMAGFLLYVCLKNHESWFLSFAFPVTGIAGILTLLGVVIFRYLRQGRLRMLGLYLVLIGSSFMLVEFFQHITFGTPMWVWSLYCVCAFGALGLFLFIATLIPPLHAYLRKTFFF